VYLVRENSMEERIEAARFMVQMATEKKITMQYCGTLHGLTDREYSTSKLKPKHRAGTHWLRGDNRYMADRLIRLFKNLFGLEKLNSRLSAVEFADLCRTYFTVYPCDDEISTNRVHYLIDAVRERKAVVHKQCKCCGQPFVTHISDSHKSICQICEH
jgi:hypothetical protein